MIEKLREYLQQFSSINEEAYADLMPCFRLMSLRKKELFTQEGEHAKEFGFLNQGIIRAFVRNEDGKEFNKQFFVGPSIIGAYTSLLKQEPSKIIHEALTDCKLIIADFARVVQLYDKHHSLERLGRKVAEHYYIEKERKLIEQAVLDADKRYLIFKENFAHIGNEIPQYHIASYLGVTPTQLSRIRKKMSSTSISLPM